MANHKRGKPKSARAGCLLCKPHKVHGNGKLNNSTRAQLRMDARAKDPDM